MVNKKENKTKKTPKNGFALSKEWVALIIMVIFLGISIFYGWYASYIGRCDAKRLKNFDIIALGNNETYAIIGNNGQQALMQKCDIDLNDMKLVIDTSTYKLMNYTDILIHKHTFNDVELKK